MPQMQKLVPQTMFHAKRSTICSPCKRGGGGGSLLWQCQKCNMGEPREIAMPLELKLSWTF